MKKWSWFLLSALVFLCDKLSKYVVTLYLVPYESVPVIPMLNISLAYNTGAAFSLLSSSGLWHKWFFAGFSILVSLVLIFWLWRTQRPPLLQSLGVSLILGGALGNLTDRFTYGHVIDFIDFYYKNHHFATFNVADSAICLGAVSLIIDLLIYKNELTSS